MSSLKGPTSEQHDGSGLRIAIVHARWNTTVIEPLVKGAKEKLLACGVKESNIVVQSCPGSYELPIAAQRYVSHLSWANSTCTSAIYVSQETVQMQFSMRREQDDLNEC